MVLQTLSSSNAHIIGHSFGGMIAQLFAVTYPDLTKTLTPIASPILARGNLDYHETNPENTEILAKHLPCARSFILPGGGHMFFNKKIWELFSRVLLEHFTSI